MKLLDIGDLASGRRVRDDGGTFRLDKSKVIYSGPVVGIFPYDPKHVIIGISSGEQVTIRRTV